MAVPARRSRDGAAGSTSLGAVDGVDDTLTASRTVTPRAYARHPPPARWRRAVGSRGGCGLRGQVVEARLDVDVRGRSDGGQSRLDPVAQGEGRRHEPMEQRVRALG